MCTCVPATLPPTPGPAACMSAPAPHPPYRRRAAVHLCPAPRLPTGAGLPRISAPAPRSEGARPLSAPARARRASLRLRRGATARRSSLRLRGRGAFARTELRSPQHRPRGHREGGAAFSSAQTPGYCEGGAVFFSAQTWACGPGAPRGRSCVLLSTDLGDTAKAEHHSPQHRRWGRYLALGQLGAASTAKGVQTMQTHRI
ncbi:uncharacterized protein [Symphalangus syndactylus]|uniref:uncharacterized protein isoform X2 n=1 Tax=Symphalangus syndactylus TaxID=9590 RepID=UPI003005F295